MPGLYTETDYENSVIELFENLGYTHVYGPDVVRNYTSPLYDDVLEDSVRRLNPGMPETAIEDALYKLRNFENGELVQKNAVFMDYLQNGIQVSYFDNGEHKAGIVYLVDYKNKENNSFIVSNPNDATVCGSTFVFDGPITLNARFVSTGKGNTVRFENGVIYNASLVFQMAIQNSVDPYEGRLEILSGSSVNVEYLYINGNAVIVVDNAEIYVANCIVNCWAPGGTVNLAGSSPTFRTSNIRSGSGVANCTGRILFSIPVGGYSTPSQFPNIPAPFGYTSIGNTFGGNEPILWEIDHDSPAFGGSSSGETILCYSRSPSDIDTVHNEFVVPKWLSECNYTIDNEASPKTVAVGWKIKRGLAIFVR